MIFKSPVYSSASGSIAGLTYSRNLGGMYARARAVPTNPNTPQQQAVRAILNDLSNAWIDILTAAQRDGWDTYANSVPIVNALGDPINVTGLNQYTRSNIARVQAALGRVDDAPTVEDTGGFTAPTVAVASGTQLISVTFDNVDLWANEDDSSMIVQASRGKNPTIVYFKGPYRLAGTIDGDATTPPTSPTTIAMPFTVVATQRVFIRVVVSRADGRMSMPWLGNAIVS